MTLILDKGIYSIYSPAAPHFSCGVDGLAVNLCLACAGDGTRDAQKRKLHNYYIRFRSSPYILSRYSYIRGKTNMNKYVIDGHGKTRLVCLEACGSYGDGWGAKDGCCSNCKHIVDVSKFKPAPFPKA